MAITSKTQLVGGHRVSRAHGLMGMTTHMIFSEQTGAQEREALGFRILFAEDTS